MHIMPGRGRISRVMLSVGAYEIRWGVFMAPTGRRFSLAPRTGEVSGQRPRETAAPWRPSHNNLCLSYKKYKSCVPNTVPIPGDFILLHQRTYMWCTYIYVMHIHTCVCMIQMYTHVYIHLCRYLHVYLCACMCINLFHQGKSITYTQCVCIKYFIDTYIRMCIQYDLSYRHICLFIKQISK